MKIKAFVGSCWLWFRSFWRSLHSRLRCSCASRLYKSMKGRWFSDWVEFWAEAARDLVRILFQDLWKLPLVIPEPDQDLDLLPICDAKRDFSTVVSKKKGTFICELILERYIYLRKTQKQLRITNYVRNKSFLEFYLVYDGVCLKFLGSLL